MNSPCHEIELLLTEYAAGELGPRRQNEVALHLAACAGCRAELQREMRLREMLGSLPVQQPDPRAVPVTAPAPGRTVVPAGGLRRWLPATAGIAAVLALVLLAGRLPTGPVGANRAAAPRETPAAAASAADLDDAQQQLAYSLHLTARLLQKGERTGFRQAFGDKLPRVLSDSLRKTIYTNQGDQG